MVPTQVHFILHTFFVLQVQNAIQALQELATTSTNVVSHRYPYPLPAHSNPNLPRVNNSGMLPRSSSHPPEMFCWESQEVTYANYVDTGTQTDNPIEMIKVFVKENPRTVLTWLGLDPDQILNLNISNSMCTTIFKISSEVNSNNRNTTSNPSLNKNDNQHNSFSRSNSTSAIKTSQPPEWLTNPLPPPSCWSYQHHRFSAGDVVERSTQPIYQNINPIPSSKSLKFHPYS